jgi:hypothetical protein
MKTAVITIALAATLGAAADTQFKHVHRGLDSDATTFKGARVVALLMSGDQSLRMSAEEALVRALEARGLKAVAAWRAIPKEALSDKDQARRWFEQTGVEGVVALRPIKMDRTVTEYEPQWTTSYYQTFYGYYGYGWASAYIPGGKETNTIVVVETTVYSIPKDKLLWGAVATTENPKNMEAYMKELVGDAVKEIEKAGLIKK